MDLSTTYLDLELPNPLIASASPLTATLDSIKKLESAGVGAVVMQSLFEEEINHEMQMVDYFLYRNNESYSDVMEYLSNDINLDNINADDYLREIEKIKHNITIPVIASLNGVSKGSWVKYASKLQGAGADALELNITYIPTSIDIRGEEVENMYIDTIKQIKEHISIPLNVKMNERFSNPANMAKQFVDAGADGLTLFDSYVRVDVDLDNLKSVYKPNITSSKSLSETLRWCGILYNKLGCSLCANSGIHSGKDVLKAIISGADVTALASVLLIKGEKEIFNILTYISTWMKENKYSSLSQLKGSLSLNSVDNLAAFERASYMSALQNYEK